MFQASLHKTTAFLQCLGVSGLEVGWLLSAPQWWVPGEFGSNDWRRLSSGWLLESLVLLHVAFAAARKAKVTSLTPRYPGWPDLTLSLRLPSPHCWLGAPPSMRPVGSQTSCVAPGFSQGKGYKGLQDFLRSGLTSQIVTPGTCSADPYITEARIHSRRGDWIPSVSGRSSKECQEASIYHTPI